MCIRDRSLFALCDKDNSDYLLQSGVLVRVYRDSVSPPDAAFHQIVAPAVLRPRLLQIAHEIPAAAHLGVAKTTARLQRHFYWPGITSDVKQFVAPVICVSGSVREGPLLWPLCSPCH